MLVAWRAVCYVGHLVLVFVNVEWTFDMLIYFGLQLNVVNEIENKPSGDLASRRNSTA